MGKHSTPAPQEKRFAAYMNGLAQAAGHADRAMPLKMYCAGLLIPQCGVTEKSGKPVFLPIPPQLKAVMDALPLPRNTLFSSQEQTKLRRTAMVLPPRSLPR